MERVKAEAQERDDDENVSDEESTDDDFNPDQAESDVAEEYDSNHSSDSEDSEGGGSGGSGKYICINNSQASLHSFYLKNRKTIVNTELFDSVIAA